MLEIMLLIGALFTVLLAKHGKRRKFRRYIRGGIEEDLALGTLATKSLVAQAVSDVVTEKTWISSIKATWSLGDFTFAAGDGPILVGISHSDYTAAEIEAWVEQTTSWDEGDLVSQEVAKRKIRQVGTFSSGTIGLVGDQILNDGKPITTKCGWMLTTGNNIDIWAYNQGSSALGTGANVSVAGHANLWPA